MLRIASIAALIALSVARSQTLPAPVDGSAQGTGFVLRGSLAFNGGSVAADSTITMDYGGVIEHTIADDDPRDRISQRMCGGSSISIKLGGRPGEFDFHCSIHPAMKGKVFAE